MRRYDPPIVLGALSHLLALTAFLWLALWPGFYQGESAVAVAPGGEPAEPVRTSASLIEIEGWGVLVILVAPVALSALGLLALMAKYHWSARRTRLLLWSSAVLLFVFCLVGSFSIGLFYVPASFTLIAAAVVGVRRSPAHS